MPRRRRTTISLGVQALPETSAAIAHAAKHPGHDPVLIFDNLDGQRRISWACFGPPRGRPVKGADPAKLCAWGGEYG